MEACLQVSAPPGLSAQLWVPFDRDNEILETGPLESKYHSRRWITPLLQGLGAAKRGTSQEHGVLKRVKGSVLNEAVRREQ